MRRPPATSPRPRRRSASASGSAPPSTTPARSPSVPDAAGQGPYRGTDIVKHRVGIVGAGQLARMMAQAAIPLGIELALLAASADDGAARVVPDVIVGPPDDPDRIRELAARVDVVTFDHELVDPDLLDALVAEG